MYIKNLNKNDNAPFGNIDINMTQLGFGCASVWGKNLISDKQAMDLFERAYELGIRYFDTGHSYGNAEDRIGKILKESRIVDRSKIAISTKFGTRIINRKYVHDFSPEWMMRSVEISLKRMGLEYIDCVFCHGPKVADLTDEYLNMIYHLKERGLAKSVGINTFDTDVIEYVIERRCFDVVMLDYNILRQDREPLIKKLYNEGIGVIAGAPLAESLYSNRIFKIRSAKDIWYLARAIVRFREQLIRGRKFRFINNYFDMTGNQIALKYVLDNPYITSAVFGTINIAHLEENIKAQEIIIPNYLLERIKSTGGLDMGEY